MENNKNQLSIPNQYGTFAPLGTPSVPLMTYPASTYDPNFTLGQTLLRIKSYVHEELCKLDEKYAYNRGFTEASVNQLMYFAYLAGRESNRSAMKAEIQSNMIDELRKHLAPVMDMLAMMPVEECNDDRW